MVTALLNNCKWCDSFQNLAVSFLGLQACLGAAAGFRGAAWAACAVNQKLVRLEGRPLFDRSSTIATSLANKPLVQLRVEDDRSGKWRSVICSEDTVLYCLHRALQHAFRPVSHDPDVSLPQQRLPPLSPLPVAACRPWVWESFKSRG